MPQSGCRFIVLKHVDSTNNYAMAKVHAGLAKHENAWFSAHQTNGKGQRGKDWLTAMDRNIALSVVLSPKQMAMQYPWQLSTAIALASYDFFSFYAGAETHIKWPNDIYWRDRKAGGILIENIYAGKDWKWAVAGVGININQPHFDADLKNPVSLIQITGKTFDLLQLAEHLYDLILIRSQQLLTNSYDKVLDQYNEILYKRNEIVTLKKDNIVFETTIKGVSAQGQLLTVDAFEKQYNFGEVEWII